MEQETATPDLAPERYREALLREARGRIGRQFQGKLDASDLVQQTLLQAHRQRGRFRGRSPAQMWAWLRTLMAGTLTDALRRLGRARRDAAREQSLDAADGSGERGAWLAAEQSSPSQQAGRNEQADRLHAALAELPEAQRAALVLRHCHGLSVAEIAARLGRSPSAVAGLLKRGSRQLRALMADAG